MGYLYSTRQKRDWEYAFPEFWRLNHTFWVFVNQDGNKILLAIDCLLIALSQQTWDWCSIGIYFHPEDSRIPGDVSELPPDLELNQPRNSEPPQRGFPWVLPWRKTTSQQNSALGFLENVLFPPNFTRFFSLVFFEQKCRRPRTSQKVQPSAADFWMAGTAETPYCFKCFLEDWCVVLISCFFLNFLAFCFRLSPFTWCR